MHAKQWQALHTNPKMLSKNGEFMHKEIHRSYCKLENCSKKVWCAQGKYDWLRRKFIVKELDIFRQQHLMMKTNVIKSELNYSGDKKDQYMILYNKPEKITDVTITRIREMINQQIS